MVNKKLKIVVVEDQALFRQVLTHLAVKEFGYAVIAAVADGLEALKTCRANPPDILLLDLLIPKMNGLFVATHLRREMPDLKIIAISSENDPYTIHRVFEIGLNGFIDKGSQSLKTLTQAIQKVADGGTYFSESILRVREKLFAEPTAFQKILSPREQEILSLIGGCLSDQEIGEIIGLSVSTVQTHRKNIMSKVGTHSTPELIRYALEQGFWKPHEERLHPSS